MTKSFAAAIQQAEAISTKKEKHAALSGLGQAEQRLIHEAFNPYRIFGVRKFPEPTSFAANDASYDDFFTLLDNLNDRTLTGNAARDAVTNTLSKYTETTATYLVRVLKKDLKCGADIKTFEAVYNNLNIPHFGIMLAGKIENHLTFPFKFPLLAEAKYDGLRLVALVKNGVVEYFSRSGKPSDFCNGIFDAELAKMEEQVGQPIIVDGECLGDDFQATTKAKGSKNVDAKALLKFFAFDIMTLAEWEAKNCPMKQLERSTYLETLIKDLGLTKIVKSKYKICKNLDEVSAFYAETTELGLKGQDEGLIIKDLEALYEWDRSKSWMKMKPVIDVDLQIVGFYEGTKGTKNEGKLGGFYVAGEDENGKQIQSSCGGFKVNGPKLKAWVEAKAKKVGVDLSVVSKDEFFRTYVWNNQAEFLGRMFMMECQEITKAENSDTYALRFPQGVIFRDDK